MLSRQPKKQKSFENAFSLLLIRHFLFTKLKHKFLFKNFIRHKAEELDNNSRTFFCMKLKDRNTLFCTHCSKHT